MDECIKGVQFLRHLMQQMRLPNVDKPTPILNNNCGSLDWIGLDWIESGCRLTQENRFVIIFRNVEYKNRSRGREKKTT